MKQHKIQLIAGVGLMALVGLWLTRSLIISPSSPAPKVGWSPTNAQAKLPTTKLWLGSQELVAEIARAPRELATGMMFRTNMAPNEAMLFLLSVPGQASFYMRNTIIPLSCAYIDGEGTILEVHDMKPKDETSILSASSNIQFVLEVNQGWFKQNQIAPGTLVRAEKGALRAIKQ
jgi:uncharacterized membrane protein (UPF0127 family)